nr:hypothetical protein [uncultured Campylobacter sp.]
MDFARRAFASRSAKNKTFYCKSARLSAATPTIHEKPVARFSGILVKYFYPSNLATNLRLESG